MSEEVAVYEHKSMEVPKVVRARLYEHILLV